jgi:hypothetical protein
MPKNPEKGTRHPTPCAPNPVPRKLIGAGRLPLDTSFDKCANVNNKKMTSEKLDLVTG